MAAGSPYPRALPIVIALLPVLAVTAAYIVAARLQLIPACNPFFDGCTSISATGRYAPASYIFKPAHLLQAGLLALLWYRLPASLPTPSLRARLLRGAGLIGAAALVVYTLTLGSQTPLYEFMRRFGIYFYFIGTLAAQLTATVALRSAPEMFRVTGWMLALCAAPFVLGAVNFAGKALLDDPDPLENRIEWIAALLMQVWFLLLWQSRPATPAAPSADR